MKDQATRNIGSGGELIKEVPPDWWQEVTSGGREVVLVNQGTLANSDTDDLIGPTIEALVDRDVLVVVALGRDPSPWTDAGKALPPTCGWAGSCLSISSCPTCRWL